MAAEPLPAPTHGEMTPIAWAIRPLKSYAVFSGRAPRAEYWFYTLATVIAGLLVDFVDKAAANTGLLSNAFNLALIVPNVAVAVRRLHDTDRSGWRLLYLLVAVTAGIALTTLSIVTFSGTGSMAFTAAILLTLMLLGVGMTFLAFMVLPGTEGANRYGPDPYGPDALEEVFA